MQEGIYHVNFSTSVGGEGWGIVVIKQGAVKGGDSGYLYIGNMAEQGDKLAGQLQISRWNPGHVSVFGPLEKFDLHLDGENTPSGFIVQGGTASMPGVAITIKGRYLTSLA